MRRIAPVLLIASFLVACQDSEPTRPSELGPVSLDIWDGAHDGNVEFFFLPPLVKSPNRHPDYGDSPFNPDLAPYVRICELDLSGLAPACGEDLDPILPMEVTGGKYRVNWRTGDFNLKDDKFYRIQVFVEGVDLPDDRGLLGFRDVDPQRGKIRGNCKDEAFCKFQYGSTIPIQVRIEALALCPSEEVCQTKSFNLEDGASFEVQSEEGKPILLDVPPQDSQDTVTMSFGLCDAGELTRVDTLIDLPTFGPCVSTDILTDEEEWDGVLDPDATATVSFCELDDLNFGLGPVQGAHLRVHAFHDDGTVESLREKELCNGGFGSLPTNPFLRFASRIRDRVSSWIGVRPLMASAAVLGPGARGGNSLGTLRTEFVIALPGKINYVNADDTTRTAPPGEDLLTRAVVTDITGGGVERATVRWKVVEPSEEDPYLVVGDVWSASCTMEGDELVCETDGDGEVSVWWTLAGEEGVNQLTAGGRGIADPREDLSCSILGQPSRCNGPRDNNYPLGPFDPFTPIAAEESGDDLIVYEYQEGADTIPDGTKLLFTATGVESELLVDCDYVPGGDYIFRGFYEPSYPGVNLTRVDLFFRSTVAGNLTFSLTAREGSYDGTVIGASTATVDLPGSGDYVLTTFEFPSPAITPGSLVTFAIDLISSPPEDPFVYYARSNCDFDPECDPGPACTVIETEDTEPPLSTFRRNGMAVRIFAAPEPEY